MNFGNYGFGALIFICGVFLMCAGSRRAMNRKDPHADLFPLLDRTHWIGVGYLLVGAIFLSLSAFAPLFHTPGWIIMIGLIGVVIGTIWGIHKWRSFSRSQI